MHHFLRLVSSLFILCVFAVPTRSTSQEPELMPPSPSVAPAIVAADSGVKTSGTGRNWSNWYQLRTGKAPQGYTITKTEFWLTGDRSCGDFAECRAVRRDDQQVLWEFRLQGNETNGVASIVRSEGHLRVIYRPR